jgi:hypothetical protein|tara:strand:+ start:461 stop:952 length:492 start_codon:yes stop_codon:yes gene_type:complete
MADLSKLINHDDYTTPNSAWDNIKHLIPQDKVIWEAFYADGTSGNYLKELGFNVIHEPIDFYDNNLGDIIISNPPFGDTKNIMPRLKEIDKPFIMIMPVSKLCCKYMRDTFSDGEIQILIPKSRIHFVKLIDGKPVEGFNSNSPFDCFYYCYKMNFENNMIWL